MAATGALRGSNPRLLPPGAPEPALGTKTLVAAVDCMEHRALCADIDSVPKVRLLLSSPPSPPPPPPPLMLLLLLPLLLGDFFKPLKPLPSMKFTLPYHSGVHPEYYALSH